MVLAFEGNGSGKIGVRFDKAIPDGNGNDLGGLCEEDHGFFCHGNYSLLFPVTQLRPVIIVIIYVHMHS